MRLLAPRDPPDCSGVLSDRGWGLLFLWGIILPLVGIGVLAISCTSARAATLLCNDSVTAIVTARSITVPRGDYGSFGPVARRTDGDCRGRKTACYQDGQWMANISGTTVWINTDTDDTRGRGIRFNCSRGK